MSSPRNPRLHAVILAGGSGTRLWPLSTQRLPKQFLALGEQGSFLQQTAKRLGSWIPAENRWVVCGASHASEVARHLPDLGAGCILTEPVPRNTAAAIALAAIHLRACDPESVMIVLPADHWIALRDEALFRKNLETATELASRYQVLVTLGIPPAEASTAYGYLERGESVASEGDPAYRVKAFHEKPDLDTARRYLGSPDYFWNSGMFVWPASLFLEELKVHLPATGQAFEELAHELGAENYPERVRQTFDRLENISVDYAVMERSKRVCMVPAEFAWDDVGSLDSFEKLLTRDPSRNCTQGQVFCVESKNNLAISQSKPVVLLGVEDLAVIEGKDAILILPKHQAQDVKKIVEYLKSIGQKDLL